MLQIIDFVVVNLVGQSLLEGGVGINEWGELATTLFCLINVGYHPGLRVAISYYQHYHLLPTKLCHILWCAYYLLMSFGSKSYSH